MRAKVKFTYEDYKLLPEDKRYEILEGDLVVVPAPNEYHQRISRELEFKLWSFIRESKLGSLYYAPFDVILSDENVLQPDILFISKEHSSIITKDNVRGAPDLVIEIISPATRNRDREIKGKIYAKYGVKEYWLINPEEQSIEVMTWNEEGFKAIGLYKRGQKLQSALLSGLSLDLQEVF